MDPFLDDAQQSRPGLDLGMLWRAFWRRKLLFFVPFLLCLSMAAVVIKTMDPLYASSGLIEVRMDHFRSRLLADPGAAFNRRRDIGREIENDMVNLLTSPKFLQGVAKDLGLADVAPAAAGSAEDAAYNEEAALYRAASRLNRQVRIESRTASIFELSVRDGNPHEAYRLARFIMTRFIEEYRLARLSARSSTREFLESQRTRYSKELAGAETELNDFLALAASTELVGSHVHGGNVMVAAEKVARVNERHDGVDAVEFNQLARTARRILGADPPSGVYANDAIIKTLLVDLQDMGVELMTSPETDSEYASLETRLGRSRVRINNRVEEMVAANHLGVGVLDRSRLTQYYYSYLYRSVELKVTRAVEKSLRDYRRFVSQQPIQSARLSELQETVDSARQLVTTISQEITQQEMNLDAGMSDVGLQISARQPPVLRSAPIEPDVTKLSFMGFILSLGLGTGLVVLAILMDRSFRTVEDIEYTLGIKVIGTLPLIQDDHFIRKRRLRLLRWATIILAILAVAAVGFLVVYPMLNM